MTTALTFWLAAMVTIVAPIAFLNWKRIRTWAARLRDPCEPTKHTGDFWLWQRETPREPKRDWTKPPTPEEN